MKKNIRQLAALFLSLIMLVTVIPAQVFAADEGTAVMTVDTSEISEVSPGDTISIPVVLSNNPGFASAVITATYDSAVLTACDPLYTNGTVHNYLTSGTNAVFTGASNFTDNGILCYLNFTVNESASSGSTTISLELTDGDEDNLCNEDLDSVPVEFVSGTITIVSDTESGGDEEEPSTESGIILKANGSTWASFESASEMTVLEEEPSMSGYVFAGWFKDVSDMSNVTEDANGDYIISQVDKASFTGTECRPKYDQETAEDGTYHAAWVKIASTDTLGALVTVNGTTQTYYEYDANLSTAVSAASGSLDNRIKLLYNITTALTLDSSVTIDFNGKSVTQTSSTYRPVKASAPVYLINSSPYTSTLSNTSIAVYLTIDAGGS